MADLFLRFSDLKDRGIVSNHVTLKRWIATQGFPPGFMLGPNTRVWRESDVEAWLQSRPIENEKPPRGFAAKLGNGGAMIKPPPDVKPAAPVCSRDDGRVSNNPVVTPGYSELNDFAQAGEPLRGRA